MAEKMSRWGIGPVFTLLSIGYGLIMLAISLYFHPALQIGLIPDRLMLIPGVALIIIGVPFFILAVKSVTRAYNDDALVTGGVFSCCRHPLYGSWVVFIVPGIVLLFKSWLGLTTPVFMYLILRMLVGKEEKHLENLFGNRYIEYKKRVPCIFPVGFFKQRHNKAASVGPQCR